MPAVHLLIEGKVQGVFFRATAREKAEALRLCGWVKNNEAGTVEITAVGTETALKQFTDWCRKGPVGAVVTNVIVTKGIEEPFNGFCIYKDK